MPHDHDKAPEDLMVEAYMDQVRNGPEAPTDEERKARYHLRYKFIKDEAKRLQMDREEIEATKSKNQEQLLMNLRSAFSENYKTRKAVVTELRKLGEKVDDQFIPLSAI